MHPNHLGSTTFVTDETGATIQKTIYYPWGQAWATAGTVKDERFASMEQRDAETGNDPALFRLYNPRLYRWLSPDPLAGDILNPQSLNRYAYVLNNPTNFIDPTGLCPTEPPPGMVWNPTCHVAHHPTCTTGMDCVFKYYRNMACNDLWYRSDQWGPCPSWDWSIGKSDRGNTISDALAGAPGTYLTLDIHGNLGFGFDEGRWMKTWMVIEMGREYQKSVANALGFQYDPSYIPTAGFFALQYSRPGGDWGLWSAPQEQKWNDPFQTFVDSLRVPGTLNVYEYPILRVPVYSPPIT